VKFISYISVWIEIFYEQVFMTSVKLTHRLVFIVMLLSLLLLCACQSQKQKSASSGVPRTSSLQVKIETDGIRLQSTIAEFYLNSSGYLAASLRSDGNLLSLDEPSGHRGQQVVVDGRVISDFVLDLPQAQISDASGKLGTGKHVQLQAASKSSGLTETIDLEIYDDFPAMATLSSTFRNSSNHEISVERVEVQSHRFNAAAQDAKEAPNNMWAFFGSSLKWGKDEVVSIPAKFSQENPFSVPIVVDGDAGGAGGGIPVVAFWTRNVGEAIGHIETLPLTLSIPVETTPDHRVSASLTFATKQRLKPSETYATPRTFVAVYSGDYYEPLSLWSKALDREGLSQPKSNNEDYAVSWCSWGYRNNITPKQMLEVIPTLKELGIHWATLDDGWYNNYGDWQPRSDNFPGDAVPKLVKQLHDQGIKAQIWWLPLGVEDGHYGEPGG
jgi:alpha-galactosidase